MALTSKTLPLPQVEDLADTRSGAEDLAAARRRPGQHQRRPAAGGAHPGQSAALAAYGLNIDDLRTTIANANVNTPKGNFDGPTRAYTINANDQLQSADDYRNLVIAYKNGAPVRLSDVAQVVDSAENHPLWRPG